MTTLARFSAGRILLHLLAMFGDGCVRFHVAGIMREMAPVAAAPALLARMRTSSLAGWCVTSLFLGSSGMQAKLSRAMTHGLTPLGGRPRLVTSGQSVTRRGRDTSW